MCNIRILLVDQTDVAKDFQLLPHKLETDVLVDQPQQMMFGNSIFQPEVVEQWLRAVVLPHHDQQASNNENPQRAIDGVDFHIGIGDSADKNSRKPRTN